MKPIFITIPFAGSAEIRRIFGQHLDYKLHANHLTGPEGIYTMVRDPVERCRAAWDSIANATTVKNAYTKLIRQEGESFEDFVRNGLSRWKEYCPYFRPMHSLLCGVDGSVMVERVLYYENFREDVQQLVDTCHPGRMTPVKGLPGSDWTCLPGETTSIITAAYDIDYTLFYGATNDSTS